MNKTKKIPLLLLVLVMVLSATIGLFAFAAADEWEENTSIDARGDANGWVTNFIASTHTTAHSVKGNMTTLTQSAGGPALYGMNLYPLIEAGKDISFWVDNSKGATGGVYMGIVLSNLKTPDWGFNSPGATIGIIQNKDGWQVHKGASAVQAIQNPLTAGKHKITFHIGEKAGESWMKMDETLMHGQDGMAEAKKSVLSKVTKADFASGYAMLYVVGVNGENTVSVSGVNQPEITEVTGADSTISATSPRDITAKVAAVGTVGLSVTNKDGKIVKVPAEYYTYDAKSKLLTIKKEVFSARAAESYLPLDTVFYVSDENGYNTISVKVSYEFDANGWNTKLMEGTEQGTSGGGGVLGTTSIVDGYTHTGNQVARMYQGEALDLSKPISFEFSYAISAWAGKDWWTRLIIANGMEEAAAGDPLKETKPVLSMIFKGDYSAAQLQTGGTAKEFLLKDAGVPALTAAPTSVFDIGKKLAIRIEIGETAADSKVYVNGVKAFDLNVTRSSFPEGAYLVTFPEGGTDFLLGGLGKPVIEKASKTEWTYQDSDGVDFTVIPGADLKDVKVGFTAFTADAGKLAEAKYTYLAAEDFTVEGNVVKIKKETFASGKLPTDCYIKIETAAGASTTRLAVKNGTISYDGKTEFTLENADSDFALDFKYEGAEKFEVLEGVLQNMTGAAALKADTDFVIAPKADAEGVYTLSIRKEHLAGLEPGVYHYFLRTGAGDIDVYVYLKPAEAGWVMRSSRGTVTADENGVYDNLALNGVNSKDETASGRAFYSEGFDVTKPIYLELETPNGVNGDGKGGWVLLGLTSTPFQYEYFSENTQEVLLRMLFQSDSDGNKHSWQAFAGFKTQPSVPLKSRLNENNKNLFEFFIGTEENPGYVKLNGEKLNVELNVTQKDFVGGKVYVGWFKGQNDGAFDVNADVNAVAVKDLNDDILKHTLGSTKGFEVELANNSENLTIKGGDGETLDKSLYVVSENLLTIQPEYFDSYRRSETFTVIDETNKTATQFTVTFDVTITGSGKLAFISEPKDVEIAVDALASEISAVIYNDAELDKGLYEVADNKIILKADNFTEEGEYTFIAAVSGGYMPLYVSYRAYENGGIQLAEGDNKGTVTVADDVYTFGKGDNEYLFARSYDLENESSFVLNVTEVGSALNGGNDISLAGYFGFVWTDLYSGYKIEYRVYANYLPDSPRKDQVAVRASIYNSAGTEVESQRKVYEVSILGEHTIRFQMTEDGWFGIYFDDQADYVEFDMTQFEMFTNNMMFRYESLADTEAFKFGVAGSVSFAQAETSYSITANEGVTVQSSAKAGEKVTFTVAAKEGYTYTVSVKQGDTVINVTDNSFTMPEGDVTITVTYTAESGNEPEKTGCGCGTIGFGGGIGMGLLLLAGISLPFFFRKRKEN